MIFQKEDYKEILRDVLLEKKEAVSKRFTFQRMADACNIEKTYLSRVLNGDGHLNLDQLYLACNYLGLSSPERQYMRLLLQHQRSSVAKHRGELLGEIRHFQQRFLNSESHLSTKSYATDAPDMMEYFLSPVSQLVHMFLTSKRYRSDLNSIARQLKINSDELLEHIRLLERAGIIELRQGAYEVKESNLHLSAESSYFKSYRLAMRLKSLERMQSVAKEKAYSLSVLFSSTPEVRKKIHLKFLAFLKDVETLVKKAPEEEVYQMNFDLMDWSDPELNK